MFHLNNRKVELAMYCTGKIWYRHPVVDIHFLNATECHICHPITFNIYQFLLNKYLVNTTLSLSLPTQLHTAISNTMQEQKWNSLTGVKRASGAWNRSVPTLITLPSGSWSQETELTIRKGTGKIYMQGNILTV
jgi:hypothetical protein